MSWETSDRRERLPSDWPKRRAATKARARGRCEGLSLHGEPRWHVTECDGIGTDCDHDKRGDDQRSVSDILWEKLYWTFQAEKIGDLVGKGADAALSCALTVDGKDFAYSFGIDTSKQISSIDNLVPPRASNSVFLPAKEVLSLHQIILK